ncbi:hydroxymethylbilane synthase [Desulfosudis oleivorans]|uniref:Porphobilinogen deaminase n=1 Tax=Desulfosudis oleivorans (strain DSM 6200 / JCM 39069 / Hxd3) TaxID=96561 RepID=HEM3_DESOH|nr:hydroxymethylbilane synthase [Desulfosudis oleivorans]A8ZWG5.1 RecName: Full=Porphobilinogen deaminase; Short=PBG; AltName: Full=Hydroxymethylbilane synthase; Short=HMBS; AltName: Full=Pre-uroporphyrinogen synthase [Desulfosudis oleivorans Hxd3]ABW66773.1 porphobilinogen deaminase [Desulfosudis oleivorans Hxd3]
MEIRIGSRKSSLAMWQTCYVEDKLKQSGITTSILPIDTRGDQVLNVAIAKIGSKGVFTEELEAKLADGDIDIAVHSAKDMPSVLPDGFELIAFTDREEPADVLVSHKKDLDISDSSRPVTIGTSSVRRQALLGRFYPHVRTVDIRGNVQTRVLKMKEGLCDAILMAYAGIHRMGMDDLIVHTFSPDTFIPPVGQGCIAVEASSRLAAEKKEAIRACINHPASETCLLAERAFLKRLEGGCSIPAFALARLNGDRLTLSGGLMSLDGKKFIFNTRAGAGSQATAIGTDLGNHVLENGGAALLAEIRKQQTT